MVNSKDSSTVVTQWVTSKQVHGLSPDLMKLLVLTGSLCLSTANLALAQSRDIDGVESIEPSGTVSTPVDKNIHQSGRRVTLTRPLAAPSSSQSVHMSGARSFSLSERSHLPSRAPFMQPPVSLPPSPALVSPAPASETRMVESLLLPAESVATGETRSVVPAEITADEAVPTGYNSVFIDPTSYSVGATQAPHVAPDVVFANRSNGCQITVSGGKTDAVCAGADTTATAPRASAPGDRGIQVGPVTISPRGVSLGSTTIISREQLNARLQPLNVLRRGNEEYVFPLSIPSAISSVFGWRMHPIHQSWRFHAGTDLAAPLGTPVLATRAGRVAVSSPMGGYGLTVILRHDDGQLESRYAHLSQVSVQPGEWVEQGEVIGLVGSTGTSTGPHLHFEIRQLTSQGWVAMDPSEVLEYGIANLLEIINNPMVALGQGAAASDGEAVNSDLSGDFPYRPAQPNAS